MARAAWNGSISFGLVQIPVELHPGDESRELSFTMLDKRDLSPVGYQRINKNTGELVPYDSIVKGHELGKGQYVVLQPSDFVKANVEATQTIDIHDFVPAGEISAVFFQRPYYVKPKKAGAKAYEVLRAALASRGRAGIATVVLHTRQHLAALLADGDYLLLELLRFADEVRVAKDTIGPLDKVPAISPAELAMAEQLVEGMTTSWQPGKYRDTYREDLMKLIEGKVAAGEVNVLGREEPAQTARPQRQGVIDLVALLRQSIDAKRQQPVTPEAAPAPEPKRRSGRRSHPNAHPAARRLRRSA